MISYKPLRITLVEKDMKPADLRLENGGVLNPRTVGKFGTDETMNIESISKVCLFLDVPIEKVVKITR